MPRDAAYMALWNPKGRVGNTTVIAHAPTPPRALGIQTDAVVIKPRGPLGLSRAFGILTVAAGIK